MGPRNETYYYLIGEAIAHFEDQLPTALDVLRLYCINWNATKSENEKVVHLVKSIENIWNSIGLPTRANSSIRLKLKNLLKKFKSVLASRRKSCELQVRKENEFLFYSNRLFDVIDQRKETNLCAKKISFLSDQRSGRLLTFSYFNVDENYMEGEVSFS